MVKSAVASSADKLRVELNDGRVQELSFANFEDSGKDITIHLVESKDGKVTREETASAVKGN